jgi:hypothetical protein
MLSAVIRIYALNANVNSKGCFFWFVNLSGRVCNEFMSEFVLVAVNSTVSIPACEWGDCK